MNFQLKIPCLSWFYPPAAPTDPIKEAQNFLKNSLQNRFNACGYRFTIQDLYTTIGHIEGFIGPPMLGVLAATFATEEKLHEDPEEHKREIFLLSLEGVMLSSVTLTFLLETFQRCKKNAAYNFDWIYRFLGRIEGVLSIPLIYILVEALKHEEKEIFNQANEHKLEILLLLVECILLTGAAGVFTAEIGQHLYKKCRDYYLQKSAPIDDDTALPTQTATEINKAVNEINQVYQGEDAYPEVSTYGELALWADHLQRKNLTDLVSIITDYLKDCHYKPSTTVQSDNSIGLSPRKIAINKHTEKTKLLGINY